jgi:hypothetical protein
MQDNSFLSEVSFIRRCPSCWCARICDGKLYEVSSEQVADLDIVVGVAGFPQEWPRLSHYENIVSLVADRFLLARAKALGHANFL